MRNLMNWLLVALGMVMIMAEVLVGAATGFDLALIGISLVAGGVLGLVFQSTMVGLFSAGALAFAYLVFFRRWVKQRFTAPDLPSRVDALVGRTGVVVTRITVDEAGQVKVDDEIWRAVPADGVTGELAPEQRVTVVAVEGVTLKVR